MAKLESIYISGIRSYGINKEDAQSLEFQSPVTLFLGDNGCGKTTVLEAVKHALTGEFPFSSKTGGQSFVADPTIYHQQSVKGCIKLKFTDIYGHPATILRVLRLEVVDNKYKCQVQDASYTYVDRDGETRTRTVKLADCKDMINMLVGITEPVLSNVLFCHQEDSLWPLSEDGNVKKKFDQIFDSSKFDRAVDFLTKNIKKRVAGLKNLHKELTYLSEIKTTAQLKRKTLKDKQESLRLLNEEKKALQDQLVPLHSEFKSVVAQEESFALIQKMKSEQENKLASNREIQNNLKALLQSVFAGTDEELDEDISNFRACVRKKEDELNGINGKLREFANALKENSSEETQAKSNLSALQEQIKHHNVKITELKDLFLEFGVSGESVSANIEKVRSLLRNEERTLRDLEGECGKLEGSFEKKLAEAQKQCMEVQSSATVKSQERQAAMDEQETIRRQLEDLSASDMEFKRFEERIQQVQAEIEQMQANFNEDAATRSINKNKMSIRELHEDLEELERDMKIILSNEMIAKEMEHHQGEKNAKDNEIRKLRTKHHKLFGSLFPGDIPTSGIVALIKELRRKNEILLITQKKKVSDWEQSCTKLNAQLEVKKSQVRNLKKELDSGRRSIEKICKLDEFEEKCSIVEEDNRKLQKDKGTLSAFGVIYKGFVKTFSEKKCCPVCETDFNSKQATVEKLVTDISVKIRNVPDQLANVKSKLEKGERLQNELAQLSSVFRRITELEKDLKTGEDCVQELEVTYGRERNELMELQSKLERVQTILDGCSQLAPDATVIDRNSGDIDRIMSKLANLNSQIGVVQLGRTKVQVETLIEETKDKRYKLEDDNERLTKKIAMSQKYLHDLRTQKAKLVDDQMALQRLVQDKPQLIVKQGELERKIAQLETLLEGIDNELTCVTMDVEEAKHALASCKRENSQKLDAAKQGLHSHRNQVQTIEKLSKEVKAIEDRQVGNECKSVEVLICELRERRNEIEAEGKRLNAKRDQLKDELRDQDSTEKSLLNNKKLRELMRKEEVLRQQLAATVEEIGTKDYASLEGQKIKLMRQLTETNNQKATIEGKVTTLEANIEEISGELALYKQDPVKTHTAKVAEIDFEQTLIEDLKAIAGSLSMAICKYHRAQLLVINLRLRDLWKAIYTGNDINYIQIESGETLIGASRRQYTYCVMQKKGDVMMPMRGKCSAGQKVLACLLVRIVLAEHFSAECGIFALDEPTTNLDTDNVKSLSQALAGLINSHRMQKNFQFLIITHDESFLEALRESDAVKDIYRVSRNIHGNTFVAKEAI